MKTQVGNFKDQHLVEIVSNLNWEQGSFSGHGVSGAVIRPLFQWQIPTFFPNLDLKIPNQKVIFM